MTGRCVSFYVAVASLRASAALAEIDILSMTVTCKNATEIFGVPCSVSVGSGAVAAD